MEKATVDLCSKGDGRIAACKCHCCAKLLCRICFNEHGDKIDHQLDSLYGFSKGLKVHLNNYLQELNKEHGIANSHLNTWFGAQQRALKKQYIQRGNALIAYFVSKKHEFIKQKRNGYESRLRIIDNQLKEAIQTKSATKETLNKIEAEFKSLSTAMDEELIHKIRRQSIEVCQEGQKAVPVNPPLTSTKIVKAPAVSHGGHNALANPVVTEQPKVANVPSTSTVCTTVPQSSLQGRSGKSPTPAAVSVPSSVIKVSSTTAISTSKSLQNLPKGCTYSSFIINNNGKQLPVLYRINGKEPCYAIRTLSNPSASYSHLGMQCRLTLKQVCGLCGTQSSQSFAILTVDAIYLFDANTYTEIHREALTHGKGQAIACNGTYIVCKTETAVCFYGLDLKKIYNTWNDSAMRLQQFQSIDIQESLVGLCGEHACRFYRIIQGSQCKPIVFLEIPHGGSSISIHYVSNDLLTVKYLLSNYAQNKLELYRNDQSCQFITVNKPVKCLSLEKQSDPIGKILILADQPSRIHQITVNTCY